MLRGLVLFGAGLALGYFFGHKRRPVARPDPRRSGRPVVDAVDPDRVELRPEPEPEPKPEPKPRVADGRCSHVTRRGSRCTRKALGGTDRCWQHSD